MGDINPLKMAALVGVGGALGALSRFYVSILAGQLIGKDWPFGTLCVNLLGCMALGVLAGFAAKGQIHPFVSAGVMTGFLGSFTTFSTFCVDTVKLTRDAHAPLSAAGYVSLSIGLGVCVAYAGYAWVQAGSG